MDRDHGNKPQALVGALQLPYCATMAQVASTVFRFAGRAGYGGGAPLPARARTRSSHWQRISGSSLAPAPTQSVRFASAHSLAQSAADEDDACNYVFRSSSTRSLPSDEEFHRDRFAWSFPEATLFPLKLVNADWAFWRNDRSTHRALSQTRFLELRSTARSLRRHGFVFGISDLLRDGRPPQLHNTNPIVSPLVPGSIGGEDVQAIGASADALLDAIRQQELACDDLEVVRALETLSSAAEMILAARNGQHHQAAAILSHLCRGRLSPVAEQAAISTFSHLLKADSDSEDSLTRIERIRLICDVGPTLPCFGSARSRHLTDKANDVRAAALSLVSLEDLHSLQAQDKELWQRAGRLWLGMLVGERRALEAHQLLANLPARCGDGIRPGLWRALHARGYDDFAAEVAMDHLERRKPHNDEVAREVLSLLATLDKRTECESVMRQLSSGALETDVKACEAVMSMHARSGEVEALDAFIRHYLPEELGRALDNIRAGQPPQIAPKNLHWIQRSLSQLLKAYSAINKPQEAMEHLQLLNQLGFKADIADFCSLITMYARMGDVRTAQAVFDRVSANGIQHNVFSYSALMSAYGRVKGSTGAEGVFQSMVAAGIKPDKRAQAIRINAFLEGGEWNRAAETWESLPTHQQRDVSISTVMLKGLVLLSAPFSLTERVFRSVPQQNIRAWALVIQSACDNGLLPKAEELLDELDGMGQANVYTFSILLREYLRRKDVVRAKQLFTDMRRRGIVPSSVTYGIILKALVDGVWQDPVKSAPALVEHLLTSSDLRNRNARSNWVEDIVGPIVTGAVQREDVGMAENYFRRIVDAGLDPSIAMFTRLMDVHRRAGDLDLMAAVWQQIVDIAVHDNKPKNSLCIPLSIFIDAMSGAYRHAEVARVWRDVADRGFTFDAQNWNHLIVSLVRAGEVERAFKVTEEILIARQDEIRARLQDHDLEESTVAADANAAEPPTRPPNRRHEYARKTGGLRQLSSDAISADYFRRWRPTDGDWRPTFLTTAVLERAYARLEAGRPVLALLGSSEEDVEGTDEAEAAQRQGSPLALVAKLHTKYAKAVSLVMFHRRKQRRDRRRV